MKIINKDSFKAESSETFDGATFEVGTVEATLWNETKVLPAKRSLNTGTIYITSGIGGKYRTSMKIWKARVSTHYGEHDYIWFGRDDRNMNFTKNSIFFSNKV